jgi:carbon-monoxide dehydrogenase small subunit
MTDVAVEITVNGQRRRAIVEPRLTLADFIRERCQLTGTHLGCEHGVCGACTILLLSPGGTTPRTPRGMPGEEARVPGMPASPGGTTPRTPRGMPEGQAVRSCLIFAVQADGCEVTTVEGIADPDGTLSTVQAAFREHHGLQCGFCTPGFVTSVTAFLRDNPRPTDEEIRDALSGSLCRCTGYQGILAAVRAAADTISNEARS